jgi:hypothetical protein
MLLAGKTENPKKVNNSNVLLPIIWQKYVTMSTRYHSDSKCLGEIENRDIQVGLILDILGKVPYCQDEFTVA